MAHGYILLHREMLDHPFWADHEPFNRRDAWIDLLLLAAWKDHRIKNQDVQRGQLWTTLRFLAARWRWSNNKVNRFLVCLTDESMVTLKRNTNRDTGGTLITILNYSKYQDLQETYKAERNANGTQTEHKRNTNGTIINKGIQVIKNFPALSGADATAPESAGDEEPKQAELTLHDFEPQPSKPITGQTVWARWVDVNKLRNRAVPVPLGPDLKAGKELAKIVKSEAEIVALLNSYLDDCNVYLTGQGHALRLLPGRVNAYVNGTAQAAITDPDDDEQWARLAKAESKKLRSLAQKETSCEN
jgi:hypothetical protein